MAASHSGKDACDLLDADHRLIKKLFKAYDELAGSHARGAAQKKMDLARHICIELSVHAQIEEELFYPALRVAIKDTALLDEAQVEHQTLKDLITQIQSSGVGDELFDARVRVLGEYTDHHAKQERTEIFAKARAARRLDLMELRDQLEDRRALLMSEMAEMGDTLV